MDIELSGKFSELRYQPFLKGEYLKALSLVGEQELHIVDADELDVVLIGGHVDSFEEEVDWCRAVETHKIKRQL